MFINPPTNTSNAGYAKTSNDCCQRTSAAVELATMKNQRRQLTSEELEDSVRLKALLAKAKQEKGLTQENIGHLCGFAGQQAVQAYSSGNTALNLDAVFRFAKALDVSIEEISPRLAAKAVELFGATQAAKNEPILTIDALLACLHDEIEQSDNDIKIAVAELVKAYKDDPNEGARIARSIRALLGQL